MPQKINDNSNNNKLIIAIDVGNTRTKMGLIDIQHYSCISNVSFPTTKTNIVLLSSVKKLFEYSSLSVSKRIMVSSVVKGVCNRVSEKLRSAGYSIKTLKPSPSLPIALDYTPKHAPGADRIANALYAVALFGNRPVIIISAGTAITVDYVADRIFNGGAILPGISLQLKSLHLFTDALPELSRKINKIPDLPGKSTEECILGGVLHGTANAINGIVERYRKRAYPARPVILTTGGEWKTLAELVGFKSRFVPHMTLIGAACYCKY